MTDSLIGLQSSPASPASPPTPATDLIKDATTQTFVADVIEASKETPVLVDFWAPWCEPCKQLGPIIEKAVTQAGGVIKLVKVNVDENQEIAQQMRVQSIPAVFAFIDGQPVDGFMGAKSEGEIKTFIDKIIAAAPGDESAKIAQLLEQAKAALAAGEVDQAGQIYATIVQAEPENVAALCGLARCQIEKNDVEGAQATLALVPSPAADEPDVISVKAVIELALNRVDDSEVTKLAQAVESNPDDFQARFDLANALSSNGEKEQALEQLLYIVKNNRGWNDEAARKQVLTFFEAWGPTDEQTIEGRKKLSAILFS
ncbi:FIG000875: Thioredoxin domain-containing protein EC-YbbN [hydrothermal vent metagenome]|uniref:FIG000875: Thioredoxin domain-containing protein EC-YbbN n=1 Tax=hydrothermal vent metagenome TaxID=652676 RepID=A0A3B0RTJ5_9ZZZZ